MSTVSQRARGEVKSDSKEHAMSESDYKGTAAGTVLGGKHRTGGKKYGHAWTLKASSVTKIENRWGEVGLDKFALHKITAAGVGFVCTNLLLSYSNIHKE